ncbi:MAG TPA: zinc ABC transporter substrate-binding protein [Rhabdochlamydiaceae bacterium]|nr:zinc ABC transporter substrate-binding protein [Rhabdochlamydiaceae bacterium]
MKLMYMLLLCCIGMFGCSKSSSKPQASEFESWMQANGKIKILCTTAMIDDLVGQIGKSRIDHLTLIVGEIDPHSYELVKGDDEKLSYAHLVFCNGLGLEHGASLRSWLEAQPNVVALGNEIQKICPEEILMVGGQRDPHIWMDMSLWAKAIDPIVEALSKSDPEYSEFYKKNGDDLRRQIVHIDQEILDRLQGISPDKRFLVTSHDAFNYFARRYLATPAERGSCEWKKRFAAPEGLAPDGQLSAADIQKIIQFLCSENIGVVFPESNVSRDSLKKIVNACHEKGLAVKISQEALYGDAMGSKESDAGTYFQVMVHNAEALAKEWK